MNRALRAATMGALLLSPVALAACSAGQVTQTATQNRDKVGPEAEAGDILLRQIVLAAPEDGLYADGDDAELQLAIVNSGTEDDTLIGIEGEAFDGVVVSGEADAVPAVPGSTSSPAAGSTPAAPTTGGAAAETSAAPGATPTVPSPSATEAPPPATPTASATQAASTRVDIPVPAGTTVFLGGDSGATVELADLAEELTAGQSIELTLTFERAGEVTTQAMVATPEREVPRGEEFDFHQEEGGGHGEEAAEGAEDIAREGESGAGGGPGGEEEHTEGGSGGHG